MIRLSLPLVLFATATLAGCSSSTTGSGGTTGPTKVDHLQEVGEMIALYSGKFRRGPSNVADLARYENGYPLGYAALKAGEIVIVWGSTMAGEGGGGTEDVVAYEKKTPTEGGAVLLQNGKVKELSAAEFAAAPKAKKS
jgi:hypothetical protein